MFYNTSRIDFEIIRFQGDAKLDRHALKVYIAIRMSNNEKTAQMTVKMPLDLMRRVEAMANAMNLTSNEIVGLAVDRLMREPDPQFAMQSLLRESRNSAGGAP